MVGRQQRWCEMSPGAKTILKKTNSQTIWRWSGRLRLRWKKTQPSSKCLFSEVSREWFNWNLLISLPFTQTVELEMIEHGKDVFKCSLYFGQMICVTYRQINLNQFQTRRTMKEHTGCFFNWLRPEFAKCWPVRNQFRKNVRVPDWPPYDQKKSECLRTSMWFSYLQDLGGASRGIFRGGQSRDNFRGGPVKKNHPVYGDLKSH